MKGVKQPPVLTAVFMKAVISGIASHLAAVFTGFVVIIFPTNDLSKNKPHWTCVIYQWKDHCELSSCLQPLRNVLLPGLIWSCLGFPFLAVCEVIGMEQGELLGCRATGQALLSCSACHDASWSLGESIVKVTRAQFEGNECVCSWDLYMLPSTSLSHVICLLVERAGQGEPS